MASLICKTVKGNKYWYIVESRRIDGKVRQEVIEYIGNQKKLSERVLEKGTASKEVPVCYWRLFTERFSRAAKKFQ